MSEPQTACAKIEQGSAPSQFLRECLDTKYPFEKSTIVTLPFLPKQIGRFHKSYSQLQQR